MNQSTNGELQRLLVGLCDGELDELQRQRLVDILRGDADARQTYVRHMMLHARLDRELETLLAESAALTERRAPRRGEPTPPTPRLPSPVLGFLGNLGHQGWGFVADHTLLFSTLALLVVAGVVAYWNFDFGNRHPQGGAEIAESKPEISNPKSEIPVPVAPSPRLPPSASSVPSPSPARLVRGKDCHWNGQSSAPQIGQSLSIGQSLCLASGVAEIEFAIGAKVILQSPAAFQLLSANSAQLQMGKATVEIKNQRARGFKIQTPEATFVDQGTEFGVEVSPGGSSKVHVFKGLVDVDQKATEGRDAPLTQRLAENVGARMEAGEEGMTMVQDTGECFIRSMDDADRDRHVVAYWRFEDRPLGSAVPHSWQNTRAVRATTDSTFNGNDLFTYHSTVQPRISADVPAGTIPQTGDINRGAIDNTFLTDRPDHHDLYTNSRFSHAAPLNIETIAPAQWTVEVSIKAKNLSGLLGDIAQTFVGRDGSDPGSSHGPERIPPRLAFQITAENRFAIHFVDGDNRPHQAVAAQLPVKTFHWYNLAATSDGRTLRLYVDRNDGRGYRLEAQTALPTTGSTALDNGRNGPEWSIGRGRNQTTGWPGEYFEGWIDEVRISDIARRPAEFLFAPKDEG